jgi:flagellar basal-body rod protein FlgC
MRVFSNFEISASGLSAERLRMDVVANNIANVETTRTADGSGPYRRQMVVFEPRREEAQFVLPAALRRSFGPDSAEDAGDSEETSGVAESGAGNGVAAAAGNVDDARGLGGVRVVGVVPDGSGPRLVYEPGHPDADAKGYVAMPNVSLVNEMVDMISASRAYQANISAIESAKSMAQQAIGIVGQTTQY